MVIFGRRNCCTMFNKNILIICCLLIISLAACKRSVKFNRDDWDYGDGLTFPNRNGMVDDLLQNQKLKGMTYHQVVRLLHRPQGGNADSIYYEIDEQFKFNKPKYVKNLVIYLKDSVVTDAKIYESPKQK
jgi:uncharacterized protein YydD (DUF2326 family)